MSAEERDGRPVDPVDGRPADPVREAPAKPVGDAPQDARECPDCHATNVGDVPFCGACGYDFVTGTSAPPAVDEEEVENGDADFPPRPTELQAAEPHEAYITPRRDADEIELPTTAEELALDTGDLDRRPDVPPPTPPRPEQESLAHETAGTLPPSRLGSTEWVAEIWVDHVWAASRSSDQPVPEAGAPTVVPLTGAQIYLVGRTNLERGLHPALDAGTDAGVSVRHAQLTTDGERWWVEDLDTSNGTYVTTVGLPLPERPIERGVRVRIDEDDRVLLGGWTRLVLRRRQA